MSAKDKAIEMGMEYKEDKDYIYLYDETVSKKEAFILIHKDDCIIEIEQVDEEYRLPAILEKEEFLMLIDFAKELGWLEKVEE